MKISNDYSNRYVNEGYSGGEKRKMKFFKC